MNKWKETLSILITSISFIGLISFVQFSKNEKQSFHSTIPKSTSIHLIVNAFHLFKNLSFNELFIHKDELIVQKISRKLAQQKESKVNLIELGWDFFKPIELIKFQKNGQFYYLLKFKIRNKDSFDQNQKSIQRELIFRNKSDGYWIIGQPKSKTNLFNRYLTHDVFHYTFINNQEKLSLSIFENTFLISKSLIRFSKNKMVIEKLSKKNRANYEALKPKGFHLSSTLNFNLLNAKWNNDLFDLLKLKEINYFSINYLGLEFQDDSVLPAIPRVELYMNFDKKISGKSLVRNLLKNKYIHFEYEESKDFFKVGDEMLKVTQIDTNRLLISTLMENFQLVHSNMNPFIFGDPKYLVKVTNAGWKSVLFELIPLYKASRIFLEKASQIKTVNSGKKLQVTTILFDNEIDISHELLKFSVSL